MCARVRVLWTHCLAKSLWGSLNRLCFPSGESIQVTDTESWLQSKWPLKSWKCLLIWHLTISDVAAENKSTIRSSNSQRPASLFFFFVFPLRRRVSVEVKIVRQDVLGLYINVTKIRLQMNHAEASGDVASCFGFAVWFESFKWLSCITSMDVLDTEVVFRWLLRAEN